MVSVVIEILALMTNRSYLSVSLIGRFYYVPFYAG